MNRPSTSEMSTPHPSYWPSGLQLGSALPKGLGPLFDPLLQFHGQGHEAPIRFGQFLFEFTDFLLSLGRV